jgi:hypothetical protein
MTRQALAGTRAPDLHHHRKGGKIALVSVTCRRPQRPPTQERRCATSAQSVPRAGTFRAENYRVSDAGGCAISLCSVSDLRRAVADPAYHK